MVETSFGTVYWSNLTPHPATGIGGWSSEHFWRALHEGRSLNAPVVTELSVSGRRGGGSP